MFLPACVYHLSPPRWRPVYLHLVLSCSLTHYVKAVCIFCVFSVASLYQLQELVEAVLENARVSSGCTAARFSRVPEASLCFTHVPSRSRITSLSFHYSSVLSVIIVNISACVLLYILSRHTVFYFGSCTWMHFAVLHINQRKTNTMWASRQHPTGTTLLTWNTPGGICSVGLSR